jgi:Gas vesicle protein K
MRPADRPRLVLEPGNVERGLVKLVLALIELIRQVMEKQAMRRIEAGSLAPPEIERLGCSLMEVEATIHKLQAQFGIDDLNLDLGPVGHLLDVQGS